jgi:glycosyltransferase involved in cell wall biosynthesis
VSRQSSSWQPDVSVIVPVYNRPQLIDKCIPSILEASYPAHRLELIVVDNGSTDDTPRVLQRYGARIRVVRETKRGPAAARNAGLRAARGEVAAFTDSDCVVEREWVVRLVAPLEDRGVGAAGGLIRALPDGNDLEHFGERIHDHAKAIHYFRPAYVITMNLACRLDLLHSLGLFDERLLRCEDVDLAYRIEQAGYALAYVADAIVYHHNRRTILALMLEGYAHGYYGMKLDRLYDDYHRRMVPTQAAELPPSARTSFSRTLSRRQERLYWWLFDSAKRAGKALGYLRASKLYE